MENVLLGAKLVSTIRLRAAEGLADRHLAMLSSTLTGSGMQVQVGREDWLA